MKVFKFYSGEYYYAFSGKTEDEAKENLFQDVGQMTIDKVEEIPESQWDDEIISIWEDNNQDTEPFKISIRDSISANDSLMLFTNDLSSIL